MFCARGARVWGGGICCAMRDDGARPVTERSDDSGFGPSAELLSCCLPNKKVTKEEGHPDIRVCPLRGQTSLAPALLRGPAQMGHPWPNYALRGRPGRLPPAQRLRSASCRGYGHRVAWRIVEIIDSGGQTTTPLSRTKGAIRAALKVVRRSFPRSAWECSGRRSASEGRGASLAWVPTQERGHHRNPGVIGGWLWPRLIRARRVDNGVALSTSGNDTTIFQATRCPYPLTEGRAQVVRRR